MGRAIQGTGNHHELDQSRYEGKGDTSKGTHNLKKLAQCLKTICCTSDLLFNLVWIFMIFYKTKTLVIDGILYFRYTYGTKHTYIQCKSLDLYLCIYV